MINRHKITAILFLCYLSFLRSKMVSAEELQFVTEHSPPYQFLSKSNEVKGLTTKIVEAALETTSIDYQIKIYPWSRSFVLAKSKKNTCIFLMSRDQEREAHFKWVAPLVSTNDYFIALSERDDINVKSIEDVKNYKVAVLKEDRTYYALLRQGFVENKNLYVINNSNSMLKLLTLRKQIDFILADTINVKYRALFNEIDDSQFKPYLKLNESPIELYLACSLQTPDETVETLAEAIKTIRANGTYDRIISTWQ